MDFLWTKFDAVPTYETIEYIDEETREKMEYDPEYCLDLGSQPPKPNCPGWVYRYHLAIEKEHKERIQVREDDIRLRDLMVSNFKELQKRRDIEIKRRKRLGLDYADLLEPLIPEETIKKLKQNEEERKKREANINVAELPYLRKRKRAENVDIYLDYWMRPLRAVTPTLRKRSPRWYKRPPTPEDPNPFRC